MTSTVKPIFWVSDNLQFLLEISVTPGNLILDNRRQKCFSQKREHYGGQRITHIFLDPAIMSSSLLLSLLPFQRNPTLKQQKAGAKMNDKNGTVRRRSLRNEEIFTDIQQQKHEPSGKDDELDRRTVGNTEIF